MHRHLLTAALIACAVPAWPCHDALNVVQNCGFMSDVTSGGWTNPVGACLHAASPSSAETGSAVCTSSPAGPSTESIRMRQCAAATTGTYGFGADAQLSAGTVVTCTIDICSHSNGTCTSTTDCDSQSFSPGAGAFNQSAANTFLAQVGTAALLIDVSCASSSAFSVFLDDVFAGVGLVPVELQSFDID